MAKISSNNFQAGVITSDKFAVSVVSGLANANNANAVAAIANSVANATFASANTNAAILANPAPIITTIQIADSSYTVLDDTAANTTGGYVVITGSGFTNSSTVLFGTTAAPAVSYVSSTVLRAQTPALSAASYPVYVVNSNGATAIKVNGLTTSSFPAWSTGATLSNQVANTAFSVSLSASSDSGITYSNTSVLPAGTTLAANGLFSGTVTIGIQTAYSFDVKATDVELQDASRTFSVTVTVNMPRGLWTWGLNTNGQLGLNDIANRSSPTQVGVATNWNTVNTNKNNTIATKTDGTLWTWGKNLRGEQGLNDRVSRSSPTQIGALTNWNLVSMHGYCAAVTKTDNTLWMWGNNFMGQLGLNSPSPNYRSSPVQVGVATNWSLVRANMYSTVGLKTDGTLWSWGYNNNGQLGLNDRVDRSSPTQIGTGTNWNLVHAGSYRVIARKTDGTLWMWGRNNNGQLGLNDRVYRSSPVQVGVATNWSLVHTDVGNTIATKTDGTLWMWGDNSLGTLGTNDIINRSSPVQVGTAINWSLISVGIGNTMATKTDGTLWSWGYNNNGQLGFNDTVNRSSPTQIGSGTTWSLVHTGTYGTSIARTT
jgi:alpha-tubulin suppressor-like RCC1 family protein